MVVEMQVIQGGVVARRLHKLMMAAGAEGAVEVGDDYLPWTEHNAIDGNG
ncbi:hypothetical protein CDL12_21509 [Handroanthus impetiginosus]|uniref:Uncharacterized protein n=1 Tax=Handroanthus impetiginosus TaxID=429701 RepID=A0A2G9GL75_9LAMI|nr:hypothetical protein CDL12_21509 [Handroanthus impetiginosus]